MTVTTELRLEIVGAGEPPCTWEEFTVLNAGIGEGDLAHIRAGLFTAGEYLYDGGSAGVFHLRRV